MPRDFDFKKKFQPLEAIGELKILMGERAFNDWLAFKFPNNITRSLITKKAELFDIELELAIRVEISIYLRVEAFKEKLNEFFEQQERLNEHDYKKERSLLLMQLNKIELENISRISAELKAVEDRKFTKAKLESIINGIDNQLISHRAAINQCKETIRRVDNIVEKYNIIISKRTDKHINDLNALLSKLPQTQAVVESKKIIDVYNSQLQSNSISVFDYRNKIKSIVEPLVKDNHSANTDYLQLKDELSVSVSMETDKNHFIDIRKIASAQLPKLLEMEQQLVSMKSSLVIQATNLEVPVQSGNLSKPDSSGLISNMLRQAEANANVNNQIPGLDIGIMVNTVSSMLSRNQSEDERLVANVLGDLDAAEKAFNEAEANSSLNVKSYQDSLRDPVYTIEKEQPSPVYEEIQRDSPSNKRGM